MKKAIFIALASAGMMFAASSDVNTRLDAAASVFSEIMQTPDNAIPQDILGRAKCVAIVPGLKKGGFIVGAEYGKGFVTCRNAGGWTAPAAIRVEGGSFGAQIGGGETDVVMVIMNDKGMQRLTQSKFTVGADAAAMAGPVGRDASARTDAYMTAEILSYSRSRGAFAGITLNGATLRPDDKANEELYGHAVTQAQLIGGSVKAPASANVLFSALNRYWTPSSGTRARTTDTSTPKRHND